MRAPTVPRHTTTPRGGVSSGGRATPRELVRFRRDPLGYLLDLSRRGDLVHFRLVGRKDCYLVNDPETIKRLLTVDHRHLHKSGTMQKTRPVLGDGLLTSEDELHRKQRRIIQPGFTSKRLHGYGTTMVEAIEETERRWRAGDVLNVHAEMHLLTLRIISRALLSTDISARAPALNEALTEVLRWPGRLTFPLADLWRHLPLPALRRFHTRTGYLRTSVRALVDERRPLGTAPDDVFSILLAAQEEGADHLTDELVQDEVVTLFFAGHETTAATLAWAWYLLARHPETEARVHREVDDVLGDGPLTPEAARHLVYLGSVVHETLRLYPPVWVMGRTAVGKLDLDGRTPRAGDAVVLSPWVTQRDERWWPDPHRFDPGRWAAEPGENRPRYAYFPFGGGPRICAGEGFATLEAILTLAHVARRWRLRLVDEAEVRPAAWLTLRPGAPIRMRLERRR